MASKSVNIQNYTHPLTGAGKSLDEIIASVLEMVLEKEGLKNGTDEIALSSLMQLAEHFNTRQMVVHDALQHLRRKGYEYMIKGMSSPLIFWYNPAQTKD